MKKALALLGSPRRRGNSALLAEEFARGARESGYETQEIYLQSKHIGGCLGCGACQRNGGACVQKDDMTEIYTELLAADVVVLASPVYFYTWSAQIKAVIDRTFAVLQKVENKTFYLLCSGAATSEDYMELMKRSFESYVSCFGGEGNRIGGCVFATGTNACGDAAGSAAAAKAYELGKSLP